MRKGTRFRSFPPPNSEFPHLTISPLTPRSRLARQALRRSHIGTNAIGTRKSVTILICNMRLAGSSSERNSHMLGARGGIAPSRKPTDSVACFSSHRPPPVRLPPEVGTSVIPSMFPGLSVAPRCSHARMSSMARSNHTIVDRGPEIKGEFELRAESIVTTVVRHR
jgi:hypothetical protein